MIKITKRYTIKFSFGGILQFADFNEVDGVLYDPKLYVSWTRDTDKIPDITKLKNIDEVLKAIKSFAYCNKAEIHLINNAPVFYFNKVKTKKLVSDIATANEAFVEGQARLFFDTELKPLLIKNKWKIGDSNYHRLVLIEKTKDGWDNIKNIKKEFEFEYLCYKCLTALNLSEPIKLTNENNNSIFESHKLFNLIYDYLIKSEFYLDVTKL